MALSGVVTAHLRYELDSALKGARIAKIAQPERDELLLTLNTSSEKYLLVISANASLPKIHFTKQNKIAPMTAPSFCMALRKHIGNGRILSVSQPSLERILKFEIEHLDEMGDLGRKYLIVELMGKHSNIILTDADGRILDAIKHISSNISSLREVLPGREYFIPDELQKADPFSATFESFCSIFEKDVPASQLLSGSYAGISFAESYELCDKAGLDPDVPCTKDKSSELYNAFSELLAHIRSAQFSPCIYYRNGEPEDFSSFTLSHLGKYECVPCDSASEMIETFYYERDIYGRIRSKSADLRHITDTALSRESKKLDLQQRQLADTKKRDKYRIYGDLLRTFAGSISSGASEAKLSNYYDEGKEITIPLDPDLSVQDNANRYFERYAKLKRTYTALSEQIIITEAAVEHLQSIKASLDTARTESDLSQIRQELSEYGYIKKTQGNKKEQVKSHPYHYISSDGYDMYVGRNNYQNEEVTFSIADSDDWWFHVKGAPGSHVIVKCKGSELPDRTFEEAASLAAHYSSISGGDKIEVDYTLRKNLKKPPAGWPGLVIYHTNYSLITGSDISNIRQID